MPRITVDPTRAICPSFEDPEWEFLRQTMIDAHQGDQPLTTEEAAQQMKEAWTCENECKVLAWNAQLEQDWVSRQSWIGSPKPKMSSDTFSRRSRKRSSTRKPS